MVRSGPRRADDTAEPRPFVVLRAAQTLACIRNLVCNEIPHLTTGERGRSVADAEAREEMRRSV
jgi:hypothetical protein